MMVSSPRILTPLESPVCKHEVKYTERKRGIMPRLSFLTGLTKVIVLINLVAVFSFAAEVPKLPVIEKAADFKLINQDNQEITLSQFLGRVKVVTFIYVRCHQASICPLTTKNFKKLQDSLEGDLDKNTVILSISFDSESDTPAMLKKYAELYDVDFHNWHFLTGDKTAIEKACQDYKFIAEKQDDGTFRHSAITFLIDQNNNIRKIYFSNLWTPEEIKQDIMALLLPKKDAE